MSEKDDNKSEVFNETEDEYFKLIYEHESLQKILNEKEKEFDNVNKILDRAEKEILLQRYENDYYKSVLKELFAYQSDIKMEQMKASTVLETEKEEATAFIKSLQDIRPQRIQPIEPDDFHDFNIEHLIKQKKNLEKQAKENDEVIRKINKQLLEIKNECMLLKVQNEEIETMHNEETTI